MTLKEFDWREADFQDVIDYTAELVGGDFQNAVLLAQDMIENPEKHTGFQAIATAARIAAYRTKVGIVAQFYKQRATDTKTRQDRLTKDALHVLYDGLLEVINCLKLQGRYERDVITN